MKINKSFLMFLLLMILYTIFGYGVTVSNDSVTNYDQIVNLDLWSRSSHFSFHLFGIVFYLIFSKLFGLSAVSSIELMLALFSAASAVALYQITLKKFNNISQAIITVVIYAIASGIFRFSCQVEYLILVPSLVIISLYFYSKNQNIISGIVFGLGLLASPFGFLFSPMFFLFTTPRELLTKRNIIFGISTIATYWAINSFTYQETLSGHWSYGGILNLYRDVYSEINLTRTAAIYVYGYLRSFNILLAILPFVIFYIFRNNKGLFYILLITIVIHLPTAIPEARYGGYQMTAYPILAIALGYYLVKINIRRYLVISLITIYAIINVYVVYTERKFFRELKETYVQLGNNLPGNSVLIVYQAGKPITNVYAPNLKLVGLQSDYLTEKAKNIPGFIPTDIKSVLNNNETLYLLESGVSMPDDYLKLLVSQFTKNQGAKVKGFALEKILNTDSTVTPEKLENYPLDVYKLTRGAD